MGIRGGVAGLRIVAPVAVLAAVPRAAFAQTSGDAAPVGSVGWLFLLFALAGAAVAFILLRRLQKARADLARAEAERNDLRARELALPLGRICWRTGGAFAANEQAARLLNGRPENAAALLVLFAESDRAAITDGLAQFDRDGTAFAGTARSARPSCCCRAPTCRPATSPPGSRP